MGLLGNWARGLSVVCGVEVGDARRGRLKDPTVAFQEQGESVDAVIQGNMTLVYYNMAELSPSHSGTF